ncbi:MAG: enoyl-CoA hydratase/isomerase family protein [Desulfobacteraceae bacterium]|nr:enoyl-CoA hydratase/isomerase family protein [Desulfobacteraceae bacterium]MCB9494087.1 enoyl-CoA hydratase/isomerase family protein [Desulfobacteraceae bacterium]
MSVELKIKDKIAVVTINRPEKMNSVNNSVLEGLSNAASEIKNMPVRAAVLTGKGNRAFSAGFDVSMENPMAAELGDAVMNNRPETVEKAIRKLRGAVDEFFSIPVPIIAAVNGIAYGGGAEIAARCDLSVMNSSAVICFSEVKLGLMPDFGGGAKLSKLIGPSRAADLILTARKVGADEALSLGLISRISRTDSALEDALEIADNIAQNGPRAVQSALSVIRRSMNQSFEDSLSYEMEKAVSLILTGESIHGVLALMEKRLPDFPDP